MGVYRTVNFNRLGLLKIKEHSRSCLFWLTKTNRTRMKFEWVQKSVEGPGLDDTSYGEETLFPVNIITLGLNYDLFNLGSLRLAGGEQMTFYKTDNRLNLLYGKNPLAGEDFSGYTLDLCRCSMNSEIFNIKSITVGPLLI